MPGALRVLGPFSFIIFIEMSGEYDTLGLTPIFLSSRIFLLLGSSYPVLGLVCRQAEENLPVAQTLISV